MAYRGVSLSEAENILHNSDTDNIKYNGLDNRSVKPFTAPLPTLFYFLPPNLASPYKNSQPGTYTTNLNPNSRRYSDIVSSSNSYPTLTKSKMKERNNINKENFSPSFSNSKSESDKYHKKNKIIIIILKKETQIITTITVTI